MSEKELGQLAWEAYVAEYAPASAAVWGDYFPKAAKRSWAAVERAVRADERERCAKVADAVAKKHRHERHVGDHAKMLTAEQIAADIRAAGGQDNG